MYITGEKDPLLCFIDPDQRNGANSIFFEFCRLNPHLDGPTIQQRGTLPPFTPVLFPEMKTPNWTQQQHEVNKVKRAPLQKRQTMHYVQQNPLAFEGVVSIIDDINEYNKAFVQDWKNPLGMPKIAAPLSIVDELSKQGGKKIGRARSYHASKNFIQELSIKDGLAAKYNYLKRVNGKSHPETRAAYKAFVSQRDSILKEFPRELAQLSKSDQKWIKSPTKGYKIANSGTNHSLNVGSKVGRPVNTIFGQKMVSYNTMEKMLAGSKVINRSLFALGAIGAGVDSYVAAQKGEDPIRPIAKFGAGYGGAIAGGELGILATGAAATAVGVSSEAVMIFLTCTPWGWVALGVIVGTSGYFGSQYGEEYGLKIYDEGKKLLKSAEKTIVDSWDAVCEHAASLYNGFKWW